MTLKQLFDLHGSVWFAHKDNPHEKYFKPLAYSDALTKSIIGESSIAICGHMPESSDHLLVLYQPEKKKVKRWKWAYEDSKGLWIETNKFYSEAEMSSTDRFSNDKYIKLEYTETEF